MKIHHIGYAVHDIDDALIIFSQLGFGLENRVADESRKADIAFVRNGETLIELISPDGPDSPVSKLLEKNGPIPYHICYSVDNIDEQYKKLKKEEQGWVILLKKSPAPAIGNALVAFLHHKRVGLIEIVEEM